MGWTRSDEEEEEGEMWRKCCETGTSGLAVLITKDNDMFFENTLNIKPGRTRCTNMFDYLMTTQIFSLHGTFSAELMELSQPTGR